MPQIPHEQLLKHKQLISSMETDRQPWRLHWRELADNYLPQRYKWLLTEKEFSTRRPRSRYIINSTGTQSARVLAAGLLNGITSPARPWFKLRIVGVDSESDYSLAIWLDQVEKILLRIMAESNFYNAMAVMYLDLVVFGTSAVLIYPDFESVIRCYNPPLGEYFFGQSYRMDINQFGRTFLMKAGAVLDRWPDPRYWSDRVKIAFKEGGAKLNQDIEISHFIGPNVVGLVPPRFDYYEMYWETKRAGPSAGQAQVLELRGFQEKPGLFMRWELSGNEVYGVGPGADALGDVIELQHVHKNKATALEKMHNPPILADVYLQNQPTALIPGGKTFVPNLNTTSGAKPLYLVDPRFGELSADISSIERRIRAAFFNDLFNSITQLDTVRSAEEIIARKEERIVLLGSVLERIENEGLDPAITRVYAIAERAGLLPPPPPQYADAPIEVQYVSILSAAQRAVSTAPTERYLQLTGNLAALRPDVLDLPNFDVLLRNYALDIGVRPADINPPDVVEAQRRGRQQQEQLAQTVESAPALAGAAAQLSKTDVGGGRNLLQTIVRG